MSCIFCLITQLDNADEQAAQIRRELDGRLKQAEDLARTKKGPRFIVKEMESLFVEELRSAVNLLMANLESLPVYKGNTDSKYSLQKLKRYCSTMAGGTDGCTSKNPRENDIAAFVYFLCIFPP